ncbi:MAG: LysM peptidoglycan-binding domain-containing protein [Congregibacter sp.]
MLRQIDTAPKDYFPPEYREVVLETGQSLSTIAKNYLGSAVQFHALAKYNGIERPRRVVPGQIVRVPLTTEALEIFAGLDDGLDASQADNSSSDEPAADGDLISGTPSGTDSLGGDGSAAEVVGKVLVPESGSIASDVNLPEGAELDASITSLATDAENALIELETEAPEDVPAPLDVDALHRRAITAYRSQDLDTAIALWDEILEADPGYESARLYRSQAKTLKKRLKSLN